MLFPTKKEIRSAGVSFFSKIDEETLRDAFGGGPTISGTRISKKSALQITTLFSCVALLSKLRGSLKPTVFLERKSGGKDKVTAGPLESLQYALHKQPNPEMSDFTRRETRSLHGLLWGNEYDLIIRNNAGGVSELWPLVPWLVEKFRVDENTQINPWDSGPFAPGDIAYKISFSDERLPMQVSADRIMHVPSYSLNGLLGNSVVDFQKELLGIAQAQKEYEAKFFGQGFMPSVIGTKEGFVDKDKDRKYLEDLVKKYAGLQKAHGMMLIEGGFTIQEFKGRLDHAMLDERSYNTSVAICGMLGVPPPLVGLTREATFSNITEQNLFFGQYGMSPQLHRDESEMFRGLLSETQKRQGYVIKYNLNAMLRADIVKRWNAYAQAWDRGVMNADQILDLEDMNPQPNGLGQKYYVPINFQDASQPREVAPVQAQRAAEGWTRKIEEHEKGLASDNL